MKNYQKIPLVRLKDKSGQLLTAFFQDEKQKENNSTKVRGKLFHLGPGVVESGEEQRVSVSAGPRRDGSPLHLAVTWKTNKK